jgi:hypothetical protein
MSLFDSLISVKLCVGDSVFCLVLSFSTMLAFMSCSWPMLPEVKAGVVKAGP